MKSCDIKKVVSKDKGITLVALIITIGVMLVIAGISINIGTESLDSTRLQGFYMHLETIQKRVDDIAITNEGYYDNNGVYIDLKTKGGTDLTISQITFLQNILNEEDIDISPNEFRYFTSSYLDEQLDLTEMQYNVFIHFDTRTVIAENGITINGQEYYMLESNIYFPEYTNKNEGTITLEISNPIKYGSNRYKIIITPSTVGDLEANGTLRYKKTTSKYWETANGLEIIVSELTQYNIEYTDRNNNTATNIIELSLDENGKPIRTVIE